MAKITNVKGRQIFDSRGNPTVEAEVILQDGSIGTAIVPSGASTGRYEAHELRDKNKDYLNKSVFEAVKNINSKISKVLINKESTNQSEIDKILMKHNIPFLSLRPGKRKKTDSTTDALIRGRAPVQ